MKHNRIILPILCACAANLYADVPNTFSEGQAATAASVNENFSNLDSRVTTLENSPYVNEITVNCGADSNALLTALDNLPPIRTYIGISGNCSAGTGIYLNNVQLYIYGDGDGDFISGSSSTGDDVIFVEDNAFLELRDLTVTTTQTTGVALVSIFGGSHSKLANVTLSGNNRVGQEGLNVYEGSSAKLQNDVTVEDLEYGVTAKEGSSIRFNGTGHEISAGAGEDFAINAAWGSSISGRSATVNVNGNIDISQGSVFRHDNGTLSGGTVFFGRNSTGRLMDTVLTSTLDIDSSAEVYGDAVP